MMHGATDEDVQIEFDVHFKPSRRGSRRATPGQPPVTTVGPAGRLPRVTKLMALAIRFDHLIRTGEITDYAEIARLGHITRARITQIMNLLHLAPDIQDEILHLPRIEKGRDPISERDLRPIVAIVGWSTQRDRWRSLTESVEIRKSIADPARSESTRSSFS